MNILNAERTVNWKLIQGIFFVILTLLVISHILLKYPTGGDDFRVYCAADETWKNQENPYDLSTLMHHGSIMPFHYPPISLLLFDLVCNIPTVPLGLVYYLLYFLILVVVLFIVSQIENADNSPWYAYIVILTGFLGVSWTFTSGNIGGIFFLFMSSVVYYFLYHENYSMTSLLMGIMAFFTIFPLIFGILFLTLDRNWLEKMRYGVSSIAVFLFTILLSFIFHQELFFQYIARISGKMNPLISEIGGFYKPTLYAAVNDVLGYFSINNPILYFTSIVIVITLIVILFIDYCLKLRGNVIQSFSFGFISVFLLLPHLKPYYFTILLIPVYALFKNSHDKVKFSSLIIISILPIISTSLYRSSLIHMELVNIVLSYGQILAAFGIFLFIYYLSTKNR